MRTEYLLRSTAIHEKTFLKGNVVLYLDNNMILVSSDFNHKRTQKLQMFCYLPVDKKWVLTHDKNQYTELMWDCYRRNKVRHKKKESINKYKHMMKHERKHKRGSGGQRLGFSEIVTDYECTNNPMHDFRRTFY